MRGIRSLRTVDSCNAGSGDAARGSPPTPWPACDAPRLAGRHAVGAWAVRPGRCRSLRPKPRCKPAGPHLPRRWSPCSGTHSAATWRPLALAHRLSLGEACRNPVICRHDRLPLPLVVVFRGCACSGAGCVIRSASTRGSVEAAHAIALRFNPSGVARRGLVRRYRWSQRCLLAARACASRRPARTPRNTRNPRTCDTHSAGIDPT